MNIYLPAPPWVTDRGYARKREADLRYPFEIFYSGENGGYIAIVPDLPGCSAFGENEAEALREVRVAVASYLEALGVDNRIAPKPSGIANARV